MGDFRVRQIKDAADKAKMYHHVLKDIRTFDRMIKEGYLETGAPKIGAEQELCLVDKNGYPSNNALQVLDKIEDEHYTNELALFNLEINLDPLSLNGNCFSKMETDLLDLLEKGRQIIKGDEQNIILTGILPTLKYRHLRFEYMTPIQRYQTLSKALSEIRGDDFQIYLQGVDDCIQSLESVLFEACNTSFQLHLQIHPDTFVSQYNWSQMIAGPVLSACVNSPLVFGKELWAESRIAVFKQSLDTRSAKNHLRKKLPRVYFGDNWLYDSPLNLWKETVMRFPLLLTSDDFQNSETMLNNGQKPNLRAIQLHNGTTYTWNRLCYGKGGNKPHIRIECRYLPAGPSPIDEIANFAFWIGLMCSQPENWEQEWPTMDFRVVKNNFMKAARYGLGTVFNWFGKSYSAQSLILDKLLPMAAQGLKKFNVSEKDITTYLSVIENRVKSEKTGSAWVINNYRSLQKRMSKATALKVMTQETIDFQKENYPVHQWDDLLESEKHYPVYTEPHQLLKVEELMSTDLQTIQVEDSVELAMNIIKWKKIHHLPVENIKGKLVGMVTDGLMQRHFQSNGNPDLLIKDIMIREVKSVQSKDSITKAKYILDTNQLSGIPVIYQEKLVGILTQNDFKNK